jgi:hypothetical protein
MTQATKHTPTPWHAITVRGSTQITNDDRIIASVVNPVNGNAAHIVRCVNEHDEMVAALQLAVEAFTVQLHPAQYSAHVNAVKAALAKVTP